MAKKFADIREGLDSKPIVIKSYELNGSNIVIVNERSSYIAIIDGVSINDGFDNPLDAEDSAEEAIELLQKNLKVNK